VKQAPVLALEDLPAMLRAAAEKDLLPAEELGLRSSDTAAGAEEPTAADPAVGSHGDPAIGAHGDPAIGAHGASPGRSGELRDELRVERLDDDHLRIARWVMRPNHGWELQDAPVLLPGDRLVRALGSAAERGVLASGGPVE
jgi:hypothetical protein